MKTVSSRCRRSSLRLSTLLPFLIVVVVFRYQNGLSLIPEVHAWSLVTSNDVAIPRRQTWQKAGGKILAAALLLSEKPTVAIAAYAPSNVPSRFTVSILRQQPVTSADSSSGTDRTVYPAFLEGTWQVTQTLVSIETPLGLPYAGGPNGITAIAEKSMAESCSRLLQPVSLQLRFVRAGDDVIEDRIFNTRQRLDSFAGKKVVAAVDYADTRASNRASMQALTGNDDDPLTTVTTRFKGPAAQKTFVAAHHDSKEVALYNDAVKACSTTAPSWTGFESQRSLFALTNASTAPPITTDSELIFQFQPTNCKDSTRVSGRLRIAGYLNPNDNLYFDARNRAVTLQDYTLDMERVQTSE